MSTAEEVIDACIAISEMATIERPPAIADLVNQYRHAGYTKADIKAQVAENIARNQQRQMQEQGTEIIDQINNPVLSGYAVLNNYNDHQLPLAMFYISGILYHVLLQISLFQI